MHNFKNKTIKEVRTSALFMKQKKYARNCQCFYYDEETAAWKRLVFSRFIRVKHKNIDIFMTYSCFDKGCLAKV